MAKSEAPQTGVTYFFTVATNEGQPLLRDRLVREALRNALHDVRRESNAQPRGANTFDLEMAFS